jgi:homoserine kinase
MPAAPAQDDGSDFRVPGSISNLGPGFDALSVAVSVYLDVHVREDAPAEPRLITHFVDAEPPAENRIESAFNLACERFGPPSRGIAINTRCDIPMRGGLGSSAAATVAGLRLYERLTSPRPPADWLALATEIEGHPDNAAAALLGGLTLSCQYEDGHVDARSMPWPADISFVTATPGAELETAFARKVLPSAIARPDAVFNLQHALWLVHALASGDYALLREALRDRWHQPVRRAYVPGLAEALALDDPAILGVCLSGSGPTIAALVTGGADAAEAALGAIYQRLNRPYTIRRLAAHPPYAPVPGRRS